MIFRPGSASSLKKQADCRRKPREEESRVKQKSRLKQKSSGPACAGPEPLSSIVRVRLGDPQGSREGALVDLLSLLLAFRHDAAIRPTGDGLRDLATDRYPHKPPSHVDPAPHLCASSPHAPPH